MIDRLSTLFFKTLREDPAAAEVASHRLLVRAGYIRRQAPGVFAWLPLGLRVKNKISTIVREEMAAAGASEVYFPALLPREPYEQTGRWGEYGDELFRLRDRHGADYLLAPTHEEVFTLLAKDIVTSYKEMPFEIYQIQDKYRDEARPRAGLLRGREFTMKDAYSFGLTDEHLADSYQRQRDAYERIFTRLGVEYVIVTAQAGAMGGSKSEEFLLPTTVGEDTFVRSAGGYAANIEAYVTPQLEARDYSGVPAATVHETPGANTIDKLVTQLNKSVPHPENRSWSEADTLKHVVFAVTSADGEREVVVIAIPGDRVVNDKRLEVAFPNCEIEPATAADLAKYPELVAGFIGPVKDGARVLGKGGESSVRLLVDPRVVSGTVWVTGAAAVDKHAVAVVCGRDFEPHGFADVANVRDGDLAPDGSGTVETARGMEIGHIFQLGKKYAQSLGLSVLNENGKLTTVTMGSYGIGITRVLAALAELNHDAKGLVWPVAVAPYQVHLVAAGKSDEIYKIAEKTAAEFAASGIEVLFDDRLKVNPGVKFSDAELLGMPYVVVIGRDATGGQAEVWDRASGDREKMALDQLLEWLNSKLVNKLNCFTQRAAQ
ncbi:proline--tRNA ligase [Canibacter sp. lx-45]|uniref:proline--tRNA ligase n=1 Tax=Canibacter zhuwentaonis TaxID=2837491 RepID=UPI001BDDABD4|nr:proline--tRNA ligase [Canibacter zhuwentaonis]